MLYRTLIKEHSQNPKNRRKIEYPDGEMELFNPSCGDLIQIQYYIKGDRIEELVFEGQGCAISLASASLMTELMKGKTLDEAFSLINLFSELIKGNQEIDTKDLGDAVLLQGVAKFPTRIRCANLSWNALKQALKRSKEDQGDETEK